MKNLVTAAAILCMATAASAGNLAEFEEPVEEQAAMGGSNAAWIIPLIAIIAIAASSGGDDSDEGEVTDTKCPADPRCADL